MKVSDLIQKKGERYYLTEYGKMELRRLNGGTLPPMIEEREDALRPQGARLALKIGGSHARKLAKEFSTGR